MKIANAAGVNDDVNGWDGDGGKNVWDYAIWLSRESENLHKLKLFVLI